jgi:hypothetical protein
MSFIILAILRFKGVIIEPKFMISFTISGFLLTLGDVLTFIWGIIKENFPESKAKAKKIVIGFIEYTYISIYAVAVLLIMVLPHTNIWSLFQDLSLISDYFTLITLGLVIILIGTKEFIGSKVANKVVAVFG